MGDYVLKALAVLLLVHVSDAAATRPNVVVILADDQGWGDLSLHGNSNLRTPHVDSLAREGARFERFYVCPVCAPTRAEFLTGRYHLRSGVSGVSVGRERMSLDETTIAQVFQAAGYATGAFGKWHNGTQYPYHPNGRGFSEFYGFCSGHWGNYFSPLLDHNGQLLRGRGYITDDFTARAIQFIETHRDQPFFVYVPYNTPHSPMQVPDRWWKAFRDKPLQMPHRYSQREDIAHTRAALAMCENIDWNVGRLLATLDRLQLVNNTIVVYFSDNGPNGYRWNGNLRGRKGSTDEGGVRSPLLIRWPNKIPANRRVTTIAAAIDLLPTLADLAGVEFVRRKTLDGISLSPLLSDASNDPEEHETWQNRRIFTHWARRVSVRTQRFCLDYEGRLYDLEQDPEQRHDLSEQYPEQTKQLAAEVNQWKATMQVNEQQAPRPFLVGHSNSRSTQLPARDAQIQGNLQRSSRHPNCSFLSNWQSPTDRISWEVEVAQPGTYEVELFYTCPSQETGSTVELQFVSSVAGVPVGRVEGIVLEAHDPPLRGADEDRVPRTESFVKDFIPLKLGTLELAASPGQLQLRALDVVGKHVMDFRLLVLTRVE